MADSTDGMKGQRGKDAPHDKLDEEAIHNGSGLQEAFRRGERYIQQPEQNADSSNGDDAGNTVKNGRYCSNGKPDRREIQVDRSLFFHGFAHTALFFILLPPVLKAQ